MNVNPRGSPNSGLWVLTETPLAHDTEKGYMFSASLGWHFDKLWQELYLPDPYITCLRPDSDLLYDDDIQRLSLVADIDKYKPPIIVTLGSEITGLMCPDTKQRKKPFKCQLDKYSGSLLVSPFIHHPHYIIPSYTPDFFCANWWYRDIQKFIDFGHVKEEYEYFGLHGSLQPLPQYDFLLQPSYDLLMEFLSMCRNATYLSTDIETIRASKGSEWVKKGYPGHPYTIGISPHKSKKAVSFSLWDYDDNQSTKIWRELDWLLSEVPQIGQNYYNFDAYFLEALGFRLCLDKCQDTLLRHHILWPELEHKLQFLTKQYTRQPYYKDEGKGWTPKYKKQLFHYNALDVVVTDKVFLGQENEFNDKPYLKG